jgi:DNA-binding response OmpR family regulator
MATRVLLTPSVLLVNDAPDEGEMYARTLRAVGYRAIKAGNSIAAYQIAATRPPDVVVTDVRIAGSISGLELTRRLRNNVRTAAARIIVLTTVSRPQDADVALKAGADAFLEKPVPVSLLKAEIARLLRTSRRDVSQDLPQRLRSNPVGTVDLGSTSQSALVGTRNTCPCCDETLVYRERWPVLTSDSARAVIGGERMRYVSGWFCMNPGCDYRQLTRNQS